MFVFVRHGESESNRFIHSGASDLSAKISAIGDPKLTELGHRQAIVTSFFLCDKLQHLGSPTVDVRASLFSRTQQTALEFLELYKTHIDSAVSMSELSEWTPPRKQLSEKHIAAGLKHDESWQTFEMRVRAFAAWMAERAQENEKITIIFGHSVFIGALFSFLSTQCTQFPSEQGLSFELPNCSISTVAKLPLRWSIHYIGAISHLSGELVTGYHSPFAHM